MARQIHDLERWDELIGRAELLHDALAGTPDKKGILEQIAGSGSDIGLVDQLYAICIRLEEAKSTVDTATGFLQPGEAQDRYLGFLADRLGSLIATQGERALKPSLNSVEASLAEVSQHLRAVKDQSQGLEMNLKDLDEALDEGFQQFRRQVEASTESMTAAAEHLANLEKVDLTQLQMNLEAAMQHVLKGVLVETTDANKEWFQETLRATRKEFVEAVGRDLEGQSVLLQERFRKSSDDLEKVVEGRMYLDALGKLQDQITALTQELTAVKAERDGLKKTHERLRGAKTQQPPGLMGIALAVGVGAALSSALTIGAVWYLFGA